MEDNKLNSIILKKYIIYTIAYIILYLLQINLLKNFFVIDEKIYSIPKENSWYLAIQIIFNNLKNFLMYIILFPLMPIFWIMDFLTTTWGLFVSIESVGIQITIDKLLPHGLIEIPNYTLYTYISFLMMVDFYKNFKESIVKIYFWRYRKLLLLNVILIIIGGLVEGLLT